MKASEMYGVYDCRNNSLVSVHLTRDFARRKCEHILGDDRDKMENDYWVDTLNNIIEFMCSDAVDRRGLFPG